MDGRAVTLVEMLRDPRPCVWEAQELAPGGHYTLWQFDGETGAFTWATVPAGAAGVNFRAVPEGGKVPVSGWQVVEERRREGRQLRPV